MSNKPTPIMFTDNDRKIAFKTIHEIRERKVKRHKRNS